MSGLRLLPAVIFVCATFFMSGCAVLEGGWQYAGDATTGRIYSPRDLQRECPGLYFGDLVYSEVDSKWLPHWYDLYKRRLFEMGIVNWDVNFDCNRFADLYVSMAQACNSVRTFHSDAKTSLAIGTVWYRREATGSLHAIVQVFTERGRLFVDPQTGAELSLSQSERFSIFLQTI